MNKDQKTAVASFLDLSADYLSGGFKRRHATHAFTDDAPPAQNDAPIAITNTTDDSTYPTPEAADNDVKVVAAEIAACKRCGLCESRIHTVPGEGSPRPLVMVIGEAPGADEDAQGRPFVGKAGQLLDRMLDSRGKIGLSRGSNCYIANILKCRPPANRNPQSDEIQVCAPFLAKQIQILNPRIILAMGNIAAKALLDSAEGITRLRGNFTVFRGNLLLDGNFNIPLLPTFHPSALLRDESLKAPVWEDLKKLRAKLCELDKEYAKTMEAVPL
jgi:DNA polymerase